MDSIEQKIVTRALEVLADINGTDPYYTTLGTTLDADGNEIASIADSRPNWDESEMPALSVFTGRVELDDRDDEAKKVLRKLPLLITGALRRDTDAQTARKFIADIYRALRTAGDKWTVDGVDLAHWTIETAHTIQYAPDSYEITGVQVEITVNYSANKFDMES